MARVFVLNPDGTMRPQTRAERVRDFANGLVIPGIVGGGGALGAVAGGPLGAALGAYAGYLVVKHVVIDWRAPP